MRKLIKLSLLFMAIAVIFPSCVSKKKFTELLGSKEAVDATLAQTQGKVKTLEGENEELMTAKTDLESKNASLSTELSSAKTQLDGASKELATTKTTLSATEGQLASAEQSIKGVFSSYEGSGLDVVQRDNRLYITMSEPITFRSGSTRLNKSQRDAVTSLAEILKANPGINIQVEGHSDNAKFVDGNGNNWNLSMNRAMGTLNYLLKKGVSPNQLSAVGRGEFAPVASDAPDSKEARTQNRRVEFVVTPSLSSLKP
jgi:chemotaxis protein MotB